MTVPAYWLSSLNNYGDKLTPWLVKQITGREPRLMQPSARERKLVAVGSIMHQVRNHCVVWGTGILSRSNNADDRADYRAVRGPLSAQLVASRGGRPPAVFGDPGLLIPRWIPEPSKRFRLGIVPHYAHYHQAVRAYGREEGVSIVDVRGEVEPVTAQIAECEAVASSSLHGLVVACAYGIPHLHLDFGGRIGGDGVKFRDFYEGIGARVPTPVVCRERAPSCAELVSRMREAPPVDTSALWEACPIHELDE